jgi:hypothetical protein
MVRISWKTRLANPLLAVLLSLYASHARFAEWAYAKRSTEEERAAAFTKAADLLTALHGLRWPSIDAEELRQTGVLVLPEPFGETLQAPGRVVDAGI